MGPVQGLLGAGFDVLQIKKEGKWFSFPYAVRVLGNMNLPLVQRIFEWPPIKRIVSKWSFFFFAGDNMVVYARKRSRADY